MSELKKHDVLGTKLCEIEAAAKWYTKKLHQTPRAMRFEKLGNISKTTI